MARTCVENVGATDAWKNVEGEIIPQKKEWMSMYKMVGQCGDVGQRMEGTEMAGGEL